MRQSKSITFARARRVAKGMYFQGLILNALLFQAGGVVTAAAGAAFFCLWLGYGFMLGLGVTIVTAIAIGTTWLIGSLGWLVRSGLSPVDRMVRGWLTAIPILALMAILGASQFWYFPPILWAALLCLVVGLALTPLLGKIARRVDVARVTSRGMPVAFLPAFQEVPDLLPAPVEKILEQAFRDWTHLRDLVGLTAESAMRSYVDMDALLRDASRTVTYLLRRSPVVAKLVLLSYERRDPTVRQAAEKAVSRLGKVGGVLHEAVSTATQFAASEDRDERRELGIRVDSLKELVASLEFDAESFDAAVEEAQAVIGGAAKIRVSVAAAPTGAVPHERPSATDAAIRDEDMPIYDEDRPVGRSVR